MFASNVLGRRLLRMVLLVVPVALALGYLPLSSSSGQEREAAKTERDVLLEQLETVGLAVSVLAEANKPDAAENLERWMRAQRVLLERRRDDEAQAIREKAPRAGQVAELLQLASRTSREGGNAEQAERLAGLAEIMARRERRDRPQREGDQPRREGESPERAEALRQLEVLRIAQHAFREGNRSDEAVLLERAIRARELQLEGRRDDEAGQLIQSAPPRERQVDLLRMAARQWQEFGNADRAEAVLRLATQMARQDTERRSDEGRERRGEAREGGEREPRAREREVQPRRDLPQREGERREGERREGEQREGERRDVEGRPGASARGDLEQRVSRLERQLAEIAETLQAIRRELGQKDGN